MVMTTGLSKNVRLELVRRDRTFGSPTYGQDLDSIEIYGPDADQGVCLLKGWTGLMHAPRTHVKDAWAYQEGVTLSEFPRVDERLIDLRLATKGLTTTAWMDIDSRLWTLLGFKDDAVLRISTATTVRELGVRLERKPEDNMEYFPGEVRHMIWSITLIACDPWWYSTTLTDSWTRGAATPDADGWYSGTVTIQNPTDTDCWLQWSNREIQVAEQWSLPDALAVYPAGHAKAGQQVMHTLPLLDVNKSFLVNTYPLEETLTVMDNSQVWALMRMEDFVSHLPPGSPPVEVPVKLKGGTENSKVEVFMTQRHDKPW